MARTSTAVSRTGPPAGRTPPAGLRRTCAVLVGLLLSGAVCAGLLAGGAPAAANLHRAVSTASGQASGSPATEQRQRTPSRRTQQSQSQSATRADRTAQARRAVPPARAARHTQPVAQVTRTPHGITAKSVGGDRAPPTAGRGSAHAPGAAHPATWAVTAERPDPYVRAGHTSTDGDRTGHAPAALGGTGVRAPPGPHAA
ncbi:hypothetical protein SAMN05421678_11356 [Actinopolymorpha cephalotaxi]|uniref:Uncharacterized protein n=1 Tax=Actinopolymorpha cephalotaxi TaxID=504797 RepID=A0A1I2XX96_9ACTN|nr:hypothetical protein [Actinopolymorpha cephalotaxi]NYH87176.1 hypothetical protein [Actinopolymorpha cephalotaxi]SFH16701.1 hypothetical protein SAMN05421678_11356 [Actinopolymorpha cephalotaxi]